MVMRPLEDPSWPPPSSFSGDILGHRWLGARRTGVTGPAARARSTSYGILPLHPREVRLPPAQKGSDTLCCGLGLGHATEGHVAGLQRGSQVGCLQTLLDGFTDDPHDLAGEHGAVGGYRFADRDVLLAHDAQVGPR